MLFIVLDKKYSKQPHLLYKMFELPYLTSMHDRLIGLIYDNFYYMFQCYTILQSTF